MPAQNKKQKRMKPLPVEKQTHLSPLSAKEKMVLEFIETKFLSFGIAPTYLEIKDHFGFASFNSVQNYLKQLSAKGYILVSPNQKRAIQILHPSTQAQTDLINKSNLRESSDSKLLQTFDTETLSLPLLGRVAAGAPVERLVHDEFIEVPPSLIRGARNAFALKVEGESMIDVGIFDGDIILVESKTLATDGQIIVATVDNESTVKRYFYRVPPQSESHQKMIELRPENSRMKSMWYPPHLVQVRGVVIGLIRYFS